MTSTRTPLNKHSHYIYSLHVHLVLVTKYRARALSPPIRDRLGVIVGETADKWDCELLELNGEPDHVHMLLMLNPKVQPSKFVNNLKTVTSPKLSAEHETHLRRYSWSGKHVLWSRSYCIVSAGGAPLTVIKHYIEHHDVLT